MATTVEFPVDLTPRAVRILTSSRDEAVKTGATDYGGVEHIFLAILREAESLPAQVVATLGYTDAIEDAVTRALRSED